MDKKYQIFISSTYEDLKKERQMVADTILQKGHIPAGMELFNPTGDSQWKIITDTIDQSDYYVLIIGNRYGSTFDDGKSYTEKEFEYAFDKEIPVLAFYVENLDYEKMESAENVYRLSQFKERVDKTFFRLMTTKKETLALRLSASLDAVFWQKPRQGWCRSSSVPINPSAEKLSQFGILNISSEAQEISRNGLKENLKKTSSKQEIDIFASNGFGFFYDYKKILSDFTNRKGNIRFLFASLHSEYWTDVIEVENKTLEEKREQFSSVAHCLVDISKKAKGKIEIADGKNLLRSTFLIYKENNIEKWGWLSLTLPPRRPIDTTTLELRYEDSEDNILKKVSTHFSSVWNLAEEENRVFTITETTTEDKIKTFFGIKS